MTAANPPFSTIPEAKRRWVGRWLAVWAVMVLLTVVIGGATRLTESGLSITEWAPVAGVVPPLSEARWQEAFARYQEIPEYQMLNRGMSLADFKRIFLWEYVHRLWARLVGLALVVPLAIFFVRRYLKGALLGRLLLLLGLTGAQGVLGWFMVTSGLSERTDVSQYRLAAHLGLALVIYMLTVWTAADLLTSGETAAVSPSGRPRLMRTTAMVTALVFVTAIAGAFVAGLDAGRAYNTFPLMGGRVVPLGYGALSPWWRNLFENVAAVQFNHRVLGLASLAAALALWIRGRAIVQRGRGRRVLDLVPLVALLQIALGITTLLLAVPVAVAALHQAGAVLLLTVSLLLLHALRTAARAAASEPGHLSDARPGSVPEVAAS